MKILTPWIIAISYLMITNSVVAENHERNLCKPDEIEIASCHLKNTQGKTASFCANAERGTASYAFGTKEKIELKIEFSNIRKIYRWIDSSTYTTFMGFNNGGYSYILGIPQETFGAKAFFYIKKSKVPLDFNTPKLCAENSLGLKSLVIEAISDVDDEIVREGGFLFPPN